MQRLQPDEYIYPHKKTFLIMELTRSNPILLGEYDISKIIGLAFLHKWTNLLKLWTIV